MLRRHCPGRIESRFKKEIRHDRFALNRLIFYRKNGVVLVREDVIIGGTLLRGRDDRWQVLNDAVQQFLELVQLRIRFA